MYPSWKSCNTAVHTRIERSFHTVTAGYTHAYVRRWLTLYGTCMYTCTCTSTCSVLELSYRLLHMYMYMDRWLVWPHHDRFFNVHVDVHVYIIHVTSTCTVDLVDSPTDMSSSNPSLNSPSFPSFLPSPLWQSGNHTTGCYTHSTLTNDTANYRNCSPLPTDPIKCYSSTPH